MVRAAGPGPAGCHFWEKEERDLDSQGSRKKGHMGLEGVERV